MEALSKERTIRVPTDVLKPRADTVILILCQCNVNALTETRKVTF